MHPGNANRTMPKESLKTQEDTATFNVRAILYKRLIKCPGTGRKRPFCPSVEISSLKSGTLSAKASNRRLTDVGLPDTLACQGAGIGQTRSLGASRVDLSILAHLI